LNEVIAVVEDEQDILKLVSMHLERARYKVHTFQTGKELFDSLNDELPDLLILDLMLPDADGLEICKELRKNSKTVSIPIIMLTAKGEETDKIIGLELGADDYVTKPFSPKELVARVKAVLRRPVIKTEQTKIINIDGIIKLDLNKCKVWIYKDKLDLTITEFRILHLLTQQRGWIYSRDQILDHLWGDDRIVTDRSVDVHIRNLRLKLGKAKKYIQNLRGRGYKLADEKIDIN